jgi:hypothetical protein
VGKALGLDIVYSLVVTHENDSWEEIPLEGKFKPRDPNEETEQEPQEDPNEPLEDPEGEGPEEEPEGPEEDESDPEGDPEEEPEGDPGPSGERNNDPTANLDDLKQAVAKALGKHGRPATITFKKDDCVCPESGGQRCEPCKRGLAKALRLAIDGAASNPEEES